MTNDDRHERKARDLAEAALDAHSEQMRRDLRREAIREAGKIEDLERHDALIDEISRNVPDERTEAGI